MPTRVLCILCICSQLCGCTSMRAMTSPVAPGDTVRVVTRDHRELSLAVERVDAERICSDRECVRTEDVATLEKREFDTLKTAGIVLLFVLLLGAAAAAGSAGLGGFMTAPAM